MLLTIGQFCENLRPEGRTFRAGGNYIQQSRLYLQSIWHFESKERLGKVCALRNRRHRLQSCAVWTDMWPVHLPLASDRRPICWLTAAVSSQRVLWHRMTHTKKTYSWEADSSSVSLCFPITPPSHSFQSLPFTPCFPGRVQSSGFSYHYCICLYDACCMLCQSHAHCCDMPVEYLYISLEAPIMNLFAVRISRPSCHALPPSHV